MKHQLLPLSETMHYILLALNEPLHGYAIMQTVEHMSGGAVILAAGTLYGAVDNLSKHGWIEPVPGESGRRKVYRITDEGKGILAIEQRRLQHLLSLYETREYDEKT
ncbi:PadR family transcriptional regulator [Cohnella endophytica]|uniref:PadR family transcriptional regulator n=1 Tax=Cohnella endophytica TaxID=2419778 RepID=A0A494XAW7_9BACL|nr:PadR family transcriptional regulator [Cohnella endophytica]RKP47905.1 PadR family transcriptional regulator [Cohnella endophytica]